MKVICLKKHFKEAISLCEKITGKNLSLPVLSNILITTKDKKIKLTATNLEIGLEINIPAKVEKEGSIAVPGNVVNSFLSNLSGDEKITLETQNNNLIVLTPDSSTLIKSQIPSDFPVLPNTNKNSKKIQIPVNDFILGLKSVWYSASNLDIKPEISSVYITSKKNKSISFVATDSFRLAEKTLNYSFDDFDDLIIPLRSIVEILRIFEGKSGKVELVSDKNQFFVSLDNIRFISRLTEGVFPDYKQIIPTSFSTDVIIDKNILISNLRSAGIFSGKLNELNMFIIPDDNSIAIKSSSSETGEYNANMQAKITGDEIRMNFNHKYLFECLQHIPSNNVLLRFSGSEKPVVVTGIDNNSFQYLLMPMNSI